MPFDTNDITSNSNSPNLVLNVVFHLSPSLNFNSRKAVCKSYLVDHLALLNFGGGLIYQW